VSGAQDVSAATEMVFSAQGQVRLCQVGQGQISLGDSPGLAPTHDLWRLGASAGLDQAPAAGILQMMTCPLISCRR